MVTRSEIEHLLDLLKAQHRFTHVAAEAAQIFSSWRNPRLIDSDNYEMIENAIKIHSFRWRMGIYRSTIGIPETLDSFKELPGIEISFVAALQNDCILQIWIDTNRKPLGLLVKSN